MASAPTLVADEKDKRDLIKNLAEAVSTQSEVANRTWLALITVALFALIPHTGPGNISLPFGLGEVSQPWFNDLVFVLLVVLGISFSTAHSHQVRAQKLAQSVIDSLGSSIGPSCNIHPRDYFDMFRKASLIHIASLAQSLRGKHQFYMNRDGLPDWQLRLSNTMYILWKAVAFLIYFVLPVYAIWRAHQNFAGAGLLHAANVVGTFVGLFALGQVLSQDFFYAVKILKHLSSSAR